MADERVSQMRNQKSYTRNPLFQQDAAGVLRAAQLIGGDNLDGIMQTRSNAEANGLYAGQRTEDALAPFLESLRLAQGDPMYRAISAQMDNLYQVFKQLHEQDQLEIRNLLVALESQKQQLHQLAAENDSVRQQLLTRERELAAATVPQVPRDEVMAASAAIAAGSSRTDTAAPGRPRPPVRKQVGMNLNQPDEPSGQSPDAAAAGGRTGSSPGSHGSPVVMQRGSRPAAGSRAVLQPPGIAGERAGGAPTLCNSSDAVSRRSRRPYFILFLPYMLHPAHHCWRFYAAWQYSWTARRTLWLAVAWVLMFLLAVGLLVGLLVPWDRLGRTKFTLGPQVVALGPSHVSLVVQLNRAAVVYYALLPEASTTGAQSSRRRLATKLNPAGATGGKELNGGGRRVELERRDASWHRGMPWPMLHGTSGYRRALATEGAVRLDDVDGDDLRDIAERSEGPGAKLFPFAVACGVVDVDCKNTNYTLTIRNGVPTVGSGGDVYDGGATANMSVDECTSSFGMVLNQTTPAKSVGPFYAHRCQRCPILKPGTPYVVLLMGDGGRRTGIAQVRFTTSTITPLPPAPAPG
ncbi:hypothetical protein Vretimale_12608 [Volvox reticuliferus]|uniref:Uncharacterized protein n=1 Tax=Volvox reticuliferus TaxID=1737510 RepID=A0A8J4BXQ5_9CHLO|nr:hypothetical protein Vretifemale_226 [Volvox reticuliferus]GIM08583.1 hypothetical protein Vretimale_12608 [Volvox reticuliferus]